MDATLRARLEAVIEDGRAASARFRDEVERFGFHPFIPADYHNALHHLEAIVEPGLRFLEWGSGSGVITVLADLLGFEAYGIEIDARLVDIARGLATRHDSHARFATGSFLPDDYEWRDPDGDTRLGTIGEAPSAYPELGRALDEFDVVFGYPWPGEEPMMIDLMRTRGAPHARFIRYGDPDSFRIVSMADRTERS